MTITGTGNKRREYLFERLAEADGPTYDELCREVVAAFPEDHRHVASARGVREVRKLLDQGYATVESDESVYLTPHGWARVGPGR